MYPSLFIGYLDIHLDVHHFSCCSCHMLASVYTPDLLLTSPYQFPIPPANKYTSLCRRLHSKSISEVQTEEFLSPRKVPAVPDPYLPGSCIAGACLELLDVLASGTLVSAKRGKTEKGLIYTTETKASKKWNWEGMLLKHRWERQGRTVWEGRKAIKFIVFN